MIPPVTDLLRANVTHLPPVNDPSFASYFHKFGNSKIVLIGDGSHGTSEFYTARAKITQYLIQNHGFNLVAAEADWPDAEAIDRYVRRRMGPRASITIKKQEAAFQRFPKWMWRNQEMHEFVEWLRDHNTGLASDKRVGFYGLDLYSLGSSMEAVIKYLDHIDPKMAKVARQKYGRLQPWVEHPHEYGIASLLGEFASCEAEVISILKRLLENRLEYLAHHEDGEEFHSAEQNARLVAGRKH